MNFNRTLLCCSNIAVLISAPLAVVVVLLCSYWFYSPLFLRKFTLPGPFTAGQIKF
jgi:hypothetical protein